MQLDGPVQVLTDLHAATERLNTAHRRSDAERTGLTVDFATFAALIPPTVVHAGMQLYTGLGLSQRFTPICNGIASTISGSPVPVYCAGAIVVGMHTAAPLVRRLRVNIQLISHGDVMDAAACPCAPDTVPAVNDIATGIVDSVFFLVAAAQESPRGERPSVLTQMTSHTTPKGQQSFISRTKHHLKKLAYHAPFSVRDARGSRLSRVDQIDPANCRAVAERRFAPTVMATTYLELYERCLRSIPTVRRQTTPLRRHSFS